MKIEGWDYLRVRVKVRVSLIVRVRDSVMFVLTSWAPNYKCVDLFL